MCYVLNNVVDYNTLVILNLKIYSLKRIKYSIFSGKDVE